MLSKDQRNSIKSDLSIAEEVLEELENKGSQFGRLQAEDAKKLERIEPDVERAQMLAMENEESMLERRMEKVLGIFENIDGRKMRATSQEREIEDVSWAKEIIETAKEEI